MLEYENENEYEVEKPKKVRDCNYVYKVISVPTYDVVEIFSDKI